MEHAPTLTFAAVEVRKQQPGARASPFHGANAGSNPAGDANSGRWDSNPLTPECGARPNDGIFRGGLLP